MNLEINKFASTYLQCMSNLLIYMSKNEDITLGPSIKKVIGELFNYDSNIFSFDLNILSEKYLQSVLEKKKSKFLFQRHNNKPKIELNVILTSRGNLAIWWGPLGHNEDSDFDCFGSGETRDFFARPENEIAFIREMSCIVSDRFKDEDDDKYPSVDDGWYNHVEEISQSKKYLIYLVLKAVKALILEIENTLSIFFDVTYKSNLEIVECKDIDSYYGRIYNVSDRLKKIAAQQELNRIESEKKRQELLKTTLSPIRVDQIREFISKSKKEQLKIWLKNETRRGAITILKNKLKVV